MIQRSQDGYTEMAVLHSGRQRHNLGRWVSGCIGDSQAGPMGQWPLRESRPKIDRQPPQFLLLWFARFFAIVPMLSHFGTTSWTPVLWVVAQALCAPGAVAARLITSWSIVSCRLAPRLKLPRYCSPFSGVLTCYTSRCDDSVKTRLWYTLPMHGWSEKAVFTACST